MYTSSTENVTHIVVFFKNTLSQYMHNIVIKMNKIAQEYLHHMHRKFEYFYH